MAAPVSITIGGTNYSANLLQSDFTIEAVLGRTISTCRGRIYDPNAALTAPSVGTDLIITRVDTGARIFGGLTSMITGNTEGVSRYWDVQGQSYTILLDRILIYAAFQAGYTYGGLVGDKAILASCFEQQAIGANGSGQNSTEIEARTYVNQGATTLSAYNFIYSYAREVVELLANQVGFNYYVDFDKNLHYYANLGTAAPFSLSSSPNGTTSLGYRNLKWKRDATRINNNILVTGAALPSNPHSVTLGNVTSGTIISTTPAQGSNFGLAPLVGDSQITVSVNNGTSTVPVWAAQTVGPTATDSDPANFDVMLDVLNNQLTFAVAPPAYTQAVKVDYTFVFGGGTPYSDNASITQYSRTFSNRLMVSDANSAITMQTKVKNVLTQFSQALEVLTLKIDDDAFPTGNTTRFEIGQLVTLVNGVLGINKSYWIHSITTRVLGGVLKEYELELRNWTLA